MTIESQESKSPEEKYAAYDAIKKQVEQETDALGAEIDPGIKDTVVALNANGIKTEQSCEGHDGINEQGMGAPWVEIDAPGEPDTQFVDQDRVFGEVAKKHAITLEEIKRGYPNTEAWSEAIEIAKKNGETEEYQQHRAATAKLREKVVGLLGEFYQDRTPAEDERIIMEDSEGDASFRIHNGGDDYKALTKDSLSVEEVTVLAERQSRYRREMDDFSSFLKRKFLK